MSAQHDADGTSAQNFLVKAREMYTAGRDDEALPELRRVVMVEPMNAEAYLFNGRIYPRRGDLDAGHQPLKTAIFWDAKLIDAHILLGRIFLERGDRAMAISLRAQRHSDRPEQSGGHRAPTSGRNGRAMTRGSRRGRRYQRVEARP